MTSTQAVQPVLIRVQATPNPNAWKFVLDRAVLTEGKAGYSTLAEAAGNSLALELLKLESVRQVHFFQNVITVTHTFDADPDEIQKNVCQTIQDRMPEHDPNFGVQQSKEAGRKNLPEDVQKIEAILDRTIRPGLQGDGGDIDVVSYDAGKLYVAYQGACGTCPSSTQGTLMAIEGILREEFDPAIEVIPV
jgi:Fe-S cluster biogenesis protein NfuA